MKRARFTEEQIIGVLKEHEAGRQDRRSRAQARRFGSDAVQLESQIWRMAERVRRRQDDDRATRSPHPSL